MGWTVLYIAFGIVALWLLGEVLLQYKARLRWRLLAFVGFLGVVLGVLIPSVVVIGLGAAAFAVGQTYVTLSFRRGFEAGWAVTGRPSAGGSKRRRGEAERRDPALEVSGLEEHGDAAPHGDGQDDHDRDDVFTPSRPVDAAAAETTSVYSPQPLPDDTGSYGVYGDTAGYAPADQSQEQYATAAHAAADQSAYAYDAYAAYGQQGYDTGAQQQYAAYSDPYAGAQNYDGAAFDPAYGNPQQYGQGYSQEPYATGGYGETPPGGVWVPQQRSADDPFAAGELPPEQPYPYQGDGQPQQNGYDERYRY